LAQNIQKQWAAVNTAAEITTASNLTELRELLAAGEFEVALVDVTAVTDPDLYDFWSQEAIVRGQNYSGWNNRRASEALEQGRQVWSVADRRPYYDTFNRLYDSSLPALTLFQHVTTYALSQQVNLAEIGTIASPRDRYITFADWFLLYRDVTISCPAEDIG
jgi:peptide/nickel transport system substrate-binding protein